MRVGFIEIDTAALRQFAIEEQKRGRANGTINRSLAALRRMFHLVKQSRPALSIPFFPILKEPKGRKGFFEPEQFGGIWAALPDYLRLPLAIGYFTAMREDEVLSVEWDQIDFLADTIRLWADQTKSDAARTIRSFPRCGLCSRSSARSAESNCPLVCFRLDRKGHAVRIRGFRKSWYGACVRVGLGTMRPVVDKAGKPVFEKPRGPRSKPKQKVKYVGPIFHDLRRTGVRNLVRAGMSASVAMAISGHKTMSIFSDTTLRAEWTSRTPVKNSRRSWRPIMRPKLGTLRAH